MRTTLDLDDELLRAAQAQFPAGTPKTVILEEALHRLLREDRPAVPVRPTGRDARMDRLIAEGLVTRATATEAPEPRGPRIPDDVLLADLAADREDR